jgi:hypothetical protein
MSALFQRQYAIHQSGTIDDFEAVQFSISSFLLDLRLPAASRAEPHSM